MSDGEHLYTLIITARAPRAVPPSVRQHGGFTGMMPLLSTRHDGCEARVQFNTTRAIKEEPKNTYDQFETN